MALQIEPQSWQMQMSFTESFWCGMQLLKKNTEEQQKK